VEKVNSQIGNATEPGLPQFLTVGEGRAARRIAYRLRARANIDKPGLVWLPGFKSDMVSIKASYLDRWTAETGRALLRFDYSGHGESEGDFAQGTIGAWCEDAMTLIAQLTNGPQILVGSSMGGWLALLAARAFAARGESSRLAGLVLIAPAVDFTETLIWERLPAEARHKIETEGFWLRPSAYSPDPYVITRQLIEEGRQHLLLDGTITTHCPVHILQGMQDEDVPWRHAVTLSEHIAGDPVILTLVKDGDHRLSREADLLRLTTAIEQIAAAENASAESGSSQLGLL
jgi:pimeloyl-ACP methyl ester carboxylesterase